MNNQIYLFLKRQGDLSGSGMLRTVKDAILGDSLDVPFVKWINVTGVNNSIGFSSGTVRTMIDTGQQGEDQYQLKELSYGTSAGSYDAFRNNERAEEEDIGGYRDQGRHYYQKPQWRRARRLRSRNRYTDQISYNRFRGKVTQRTLQEQAHYRNQWQNVGAERQETSYELNKPFYTPKFENSKLKIKLPEHNEFVFTKNVDNATPQLAYAASSQEPIRHAVFAFRRRIGVGVQGVRLPYMMLFLRDCLVTSWELDGDTEKVSLNYKIVRWLTYDQVTDWNYPTGMSNRYWDNSDSSGGEDAKLYIFMGVLMAAFAAAGALTQALIKPYGKDDENDSKDRKDKRKEIE